MAEASIRAAHLFRTIAALILIALGPAAAAQEADAVRAAQIKAAILVNFLRYTEWPPERFADDEAPYKVAVIGSPAVADTLDAMVQGSRRIGGRPLQVERLELPRGGLAALAPEAAASFVATLRRQNLAYIGASRPAEIAELLRALDGAQVLSVGDADHFAASGGAIGLALADERIVFDANLATMRRANLTVSAQVLKLARRIEAGRPRRPK